MGLETLREQAFSASLRSIFGLDNFGMAVAEHTEEDLPDVFDEPGLAGVDVAGAFEIAVHADVVRIVKEIADRSTIERFLDSPTTKPLGKSPVRQGLGIASINASEVALSACDADILGAVEEVADRATPESGVDAVGTKPAGLSPIRNRLRRGKILLTCVDSSGTSHAHILVAFGEIAFCPTIEGCVSPVAAKSLGPFPIGDFCG